MLERNIHDGAQQHLVALAVNLRLAETLSLRSRERAETLLAEQDRAAAVAIDVLMDLSRGIYPTTLAADGSVALTAAVGTSVVPVEVSAVDVGRYAAGVEATAYFCCLEAVQNATKHSGATTIRVSLDGRDGMADLPRRGRRRRLRPGHDSRRDRAGEPARPDRVGRRHARRPSPRRAGAPGSGQRCRHRALSEHGTDRRRG